MSLAVRPEFAVPDVPRRGGTKLPPKRKPVVLEEEAYVSALETIIQRDFFPDLAKLRAQLEYLDAVNANDLDQMHAISRRYQTPVAAGTATPRCFETPLPGEARDLGLEGPPDDSATPDAGEAQAGPPKVDTSLSLDAFVDRFTSEDNADFGEMMETAKTRLRQRYAWVYAKAQSAGQQLALTADNVERKALERAQGQYMAIEGWQYTPKNTLMYSPDGLALSATEAVEQAKKKRRVVRHHNTRFDHGPFPATLTPGIRDGTGASTASGASGPGAAAAAAAAAVRGAVGSDSPRVNGYGFVRTPSPGRDTGVWGVIDGQVFALDGSDSVRATASVPGYTVPHQAPRETLAHKMVDDIKLKQRRQEAARTPRASGGTAAGGGAATPRTPSVARLAAMSPAAQRLAQGFQSFPAMSPATRRGTPGGSVRDSLRATYGGGGGGGGVGTPSAAGPGRLPGAAGSALARAPTPRTPRLPASSITDNLLA